MSTIKLETLNEAVCVVGNACMSRLCTSQEVVVDTLRAIAKALDDTPGWGDDSDSLEAIANRIENSDMVTSRA